ncbi:DUF2189 domain-containing protein [uncultured Tateyamaria sp.]|uniref:DUF2189 domain-containing protein n=1 Tax=uncultured Tateyamaria sp. TaxID=455651 RepID=UPI002628634A|nr:DUF2189 domain-containing protein [uncultured Tateyamaria sp.]
MDLAAARTPPWKARRVEEPIATVIKRWLQLAVSDLKRHPTTAVCYGIALCAAGWVTILLLWYFDLEWALLPILAGGMLVGPLAAVGLYSMSRRGQDEGTTDVASPEQVILIGIILMVFALAWIRAATLIFAIFFGLLPFAGFVETMTTLLSSPQGIATILVGSVFGGLFAALGFAISVFSIPMLVDRKIDCFSAMGLSFNATTHNFRLMISWAVVVCAGILIGLLTGLLGLIFIFPLLGFATWHAYCDLFKGARA